MAYYCTSGTTFIGEDRIREVIQDKHPGVPNTDPLSAAKATLKTLEVSSLGLITPYNPILTYFMQKPFVSANIKIKMVWSFYEKNDEAVARINTKSILDAAISLGSSDLVYGIFISWTSLRATKIIEQVDQILRKPVT